MNRTTIAAVFALLFWATTALGAAFDPNGYLVMPDANGNPTTRFVLGVYDTTGYYNSIAGWSANLDSVLSGYGSDPLPTKNIDLVLDYTIGNAPDAYLAEFGEALAARGMGAIISADQYDREDYTDATMTTINSVFVTARAAALAGAPGIVGFYVVDEGLNGQQANVAATVKALRAGDSSALLLGDILAPYIGDVPKSFTVPSQWWPYVDVACTDPYAIYNLYGLNTDLIHISTARKPHAPYWHVAQFWGDSDGVSRWPTRDQLRAETWIAICSGAQGVFYWSLGQKGLQNVTDSVQKANRWHDLLIVIGEVKSYEPILTLPSVIAASVPKGVLAISKQTADGVTHVFSINPTDTTLTDPASGRSWAGGQTQFWTF